jgi:hypothetical protein
VKLKILISDLLGPNAFSATQEYKSESLLSTEGIVNVDVTTKKPSIIVVGSMVPLSAILSFSMTPRYHIKVGAGNPVAVHVKTAFSPSMVVTSVSSSGLVILGGAMYQYKE